MKHGSALRSLLLAVLITLSFQQRIFAQRAGQAPPTGVYRASIEPHWLGGSSRFWYRNDLGEARHEFVLVDAEGGTRQPAFDHARVAGALSKRVGTDVSAQNLPVNSLDFAADFKSVTLLGTDNSWKLDLETYGLTEQAAPPHPATNPTTQGRRRGGAGGGGFSSRTSRSPDGKWEAFARDHNLFLRDLSTQNEFLLTSDGTEKDTYHRDTTRARGVDMQFTLTDAPPASVEVYWSPDSRRLVAMRTHTAALRTVFEVSSSPIDQLQPKLTSYPYFKPGDDIPLQKPHLFDVQARQEIPVGDELFSNPFHISAVRWDDDARRFTFLYNQRGHQALRIIAVDAKTGAASAIIDEQSKTFIDYSGKFFDEYLEDTGEIIWMSERSGFNHLYLFDASNSKLKNPITRGPWVVRGIDRVDRDKRQIWFHASGIYPGQDPYLVHYCRVNFDGMGLTILTDGDGYHSVQFSPDRRFIIDTFSRVDAPAAHQLRSAESGKLICNLEQADVTEYLATHHRFPEPFVAKGRDGQTDIYGVIWRPTDFDPAKKYAVIENIYAGPQDSFVAKNFRGRYPQQALADRGFIVVQIDAMGTSNRSKAFHDVCWKNLGDAGFPDRILWIKAAAAKYSYVDLSRVGIYGTSAGGQNSLRGMLAHGDFYKVCVSDSGCHDNRMDKIWWNEQWMGYPIGPEYAEQSNVTQAHLLQGKLLLMWGELDRNVDPSSTVQVINALIKANKPFDMLMVPGAGHGVAGTPYGRRKLEEFFIKNLE